MAGPDTSGVLSKQAETAFKLVVLLMSIAGAGFALSQTLATKPSGGATAAQVEQLSQEVAGLRMDARETLKRVQAIEIEQARQQGARDANFRERR